MSQFQVPSVTIISTMIALIEQYDLRIAPIAAA